jgi:hypothetical protein
MHDTFIKLYIDNNTENLFEFLNSIDYNKLDYDIEINIFILYTFIKIKYIYHLFNNDDLLTIIKNHSEILYNELIKHISAHDIQYYNDKIILLESKYKFEKLIIICIHNLKIIKKCISIEEKNIAIQNMRNKCLLIIDNDILYNKWLEIYCELFNTNYKFELQHMDIRQKLIYIDRFCNTNNYNETKQILENIKNIDILINYINFNKIICDISTIKDIYIEPLLIIELLEKIYNFNNTNIHDIKLGLKMIILMRLSNLLIKFNKNIYFEKYKEVFQKYYDDNIIMFDENIHPKINTMVNRNYFGYIINYSKNNEEIIKYSKKLVNIIETSLDKQINLNDILDIIILLYRLNDNDKIIEIYDKYKLIISNAFINGNKNIIESLYSIIVFIFKSNNIQLIKNMKSDIEKISLVHNDIKLKCFDLIKKIEFYEKIVNDLDFIITNIKDITTDSKGLRNDKDEIICTICLDSIKFNKTAVIECKFCHKYIGHYLCICEYIIDKKNNKQQIECPTCREKY